MTGMTETTEKLAEKIDLYFPNKEECEVWVKGASSVEEALTEICKFLEDRNASPGRYSGYWCDAPGGGYYRIFAEWEFGQGNKWFWEYIPEPTKEQLRLIMEHQAITKAWWKEVDSYPPECTGDDLGAARWGKNMALRIIDALIRGDKARAEQLRREVAESETTNWERELRWSSIALHAGKDTGA